jgi:hypothetical protein
VRNYCISKVLERLNIVDCFSIFTYRQNSHPLWYSPGYCVTELRSLIEVADVLRPLLPATPEVPTPSDPLKGKGPKKPCICLNNAMSLLCMRIVNIGRTRHPYFFCVLIQSSIALKFNHSLD